MSRSYRKRPFTGNTTKDSEKEDKRVFNGKLRAKAKQALVQEKEVFPTKNEALTTWEMDKDGKQYISIKNRKEWPAWKRK